MTGNPSNFKIQKVLLRVAGISLREHETKTYRICSLIFLTFVSVYPFLALIDVFRQDFETATELVKYEFTFIVAVFKVIMFHRSRVVITQLLDKLDAGRFLANLRLKNDKEEELMKQCSFIVITQTIIYLAICFVALCTNVVYTFIIRCRSSDYHDWKWSYGSFQLVNATYSPNFEILWSYQSFTSCTLSYFFVVIDATVGGILCHIVFELKLLQNNIRSIVEDSHEEMLKEKYGDLSTPDLNDGVVSTDIEYYVVEWKYLRQSVHRVVKYHLAIINIVSDVNDTFRNFVLMAFLGTLGILAFMVYRASKIPANDFRLITSLSEISVITLQVLMFCYWAEHIMSEGKDVGLAAYESNFVGTDLRFQKCMTFIMRRSQTPLTIGAGKFVDISLSTFFWIMRSAYSTFMVLRKRHAVDQN